MEIMEEERSKSNGKEVMVDVEDAEPIELVLYQVSECYVYMIPPRKSAASYRADEWDVNKWAWEGALKVVNRGEECIIRLEDKSTGELYARAFLREGEPHPVEPVIDSSRYFVLRVEENIDGRLRHAFIGVGFRERTEAYDFQAALHDHIKYLDKKKTAEEMEQQFQNTTSHDYSLKEGETLVLDLKNKSAGIVRSKSLEHESANGVSPNAPDNQKEPCLSIKLPPPPPSSTVSPVKTKSPMTTTPTSVSPRGSFTEEETRELKEKKPQSDSTEAPDDDFGDFQTAG